MAIVHTPLRVLSSGIFNLILTMGIARFAYTPLLPIMQDQTWLNDAYGGWLATINYLGYMLGAWLAATMSDMNKKYILCKLGILVALMTTAGMAVTDNLFVWCFFRFFAGLSSASGSLLCVALILNWLMRHNHRSELGLLFAGVGIGIAGCSVLIGLLSSYIDWAQHWWVLAMIGALLAIPSWRWMPPPPNQAELTIAEHMRDNPPSGRLMKLMMIAYFCAGFGFVVSATFIVAIIERIPELSGRGELAFTLLGIAAIPACIIWDRIARRIGELPALLSAYLLQIIGIILPVFSQTLFSALFSAIMFGATFIGIVSLVLTMAGRFYPSKPAKLMGKMTLAYCVAQILAPALVGTVAEITGSYDIGLYLASLLMVVGAVMIAILIWDKRKAVKVERVV